MEFIKTPLQDTIVIDAIITFHYFQYARDFVFAGEQHDFWEMAYVDKGEAGVIADSTGYVLHQGEAIFHKPNEYHNIWANGMYTNVMIITFDCKSPDMDFFKNKIIRLEPEHRMILSELYSIAPFAGPHDILGQTGVAIAETAPRGSEQLFKNYLEILLLKLCQAGSHIARAQRRSASSKTQNEQNVADALVKILEDNVHNTLRFEDVAAKLCFSKSYLKKLFHVKYGKGMMEYFLDLKIEEAKKKISERELSFTQIAEALSFSSLHYFSKIFKIKTGMSPRDFGKSVRSKQLL